MIIYVSHEYGGWPLNIERAKTITNYIQKMDTDNCYICPLLAFSHLSYGELGGDIDMRLCIDLLSVSDKLLVVGNISPGMQKEIDFAKLAKMPILYLSFDRKRINRILLLHLMGKKPDLSRFPVSVAEAERD